MRSNPLFTLSAVAAVMIFSGCKSDEPVAQNAGTDVSSHGSGSNAHVDMATLPSGSTIDVTLSTPLTSETASVGASWSGTIRNASMLAGRDLIPVGSSVSGTIAGVTPAKKGDRAMLDLVLTSVTVNGRSYPMRGSMESVIAGSTRARNLGAIGAATAAGALVGHAIGGSGKGTLVGAVVGGGAATGAVSQTRGWQVVLKEGTPLTFTTNEAVAVRY
jgi:hypothetical protein